MYEVIKALQGQMRIMIATKFPFSARTLLSTLLLYFVELEILTARAGIYKSDNLQYNSLVCWFTGTNDSSTKGLMFQVLFFSQFLAKFFEKSFQSFECLEFIRNYLEKDNAWNIRCLTPINQ